MSHGILLGKQAKFSMSLLGISCEILREIFMQSGQKRENSMVTSWDFMESLWKFHGVISRGILWSVHGKFHMAFPNGIPWRYTTETALLHDRPDFSRGTM